MTRATLLRVLLAGAIAIATGVHEARAQCPPTTNFCPPPRGPQPGPSSPDGGGSGSGNQVGFYILGAVVTAIIGWVIKTQIFPDPPPSGPPQDAPPLPPGPPNPPPLAQIQTSPGTQTAARGLRPTCNLPPVGETHYVTNELVIDANASDQALRAIAARHNMTRLETVTFRLTGRTLHRWRI